MSRYHSWSLQLFIIKRNKLWDIVWSVEVYIAAIGISSVIAKGLNRHFVKKKKKKSVKISYKQTITRIFSQLKLEEIHRGE